MRLQNNIKYSGLCADDQIKYCGAVGMSSYLAKQTLFTSKFSGFTLNKNPYYVYYVCFYYYVYFFYYVYFYYYVYYVSDLSRVFWGKMGTLNLQRRPHGQGRAQKFSKYVPADTLKMHSLALSVLTFLCKTFSTSIKLSLRKTLFRGSFFKKSYIQIKNLYDYKLVTAAK